MSESFTEYNTVNQPTQHDQHQDIDNNYDSVTEGLATVLFPTGQVFYNNVQNFNRDISVLVIKLFAEIWNNEQNDKHNNKKYKHSKQHKQDNNNTQDNTLQQDTAPTDITMQQHNNQQHQQEQQQHDNVHSVRIIEAFAASGLRSIRYALELPQQYITQIIINDMDKTAIQSIKRNIIHNKLNSDVYKDKIYISHNDCNSMLFGYRYNMINKQDNRVEVIDLDPYGSASEYIDSAIQSILDGGLLCVTCTDKAVLCGNNSETCYAKYGSVSIRMSCHAELALRILLNCIDTIAARYKRYIVPLLSISVDFYVRVFVRVYTSAAKVKYTASKQSMLYVCSQCHMYNTQPLHNVKIDGNSIKHQNIQFNIPLDNNSKCSQCHSTIHVAGPIYNAPMHDTTFINNALQQIKQESSLYTTSQRIIGTLSVINNELHDIPLYYTLPSLCHTFKLTPPKISLIRSALLNSNYNVSSSHCSAEAIKTNAPNHILYDIMRNYAHYINHKLQFTQDDKSINSILLQHQPNITTDFTIVEGTDYSSKSTGIAKFLPNPEPYYGPRSVASSSSYNNNNNNKRSIDSNISKLSSNVHNNASYILHDRSIANQNKRSKKRKICRRHLNGTCKLSDDKCKYSHKLIHYTNNTSDNIQQSLTSNDNVETIAELADIDTQQSE